MFATMMQLAADIASDEEAEGGEEASDGEEADDGDADIEGGDSTALLLGGGGVSNGDDDAEGEVDGEDGSDADGDERDTSAFKGRGKGDTATGTTKSSKQAKNQKVQRGGRPVLVLQCTVGRGLLLANVEHGFSLSNIAIMHV